MLLEEGDALEVLRGLFFFSENCLNGNSGGMFGENLVRAVGIAIGEHMLYRLYLWITERFY